MPERGVKEQSEQFPNRNKPPKVEHVRTHNDNDSVKLDLLVHWDISEIIREDEQESTQMWQYEEEKLYGVKYKGDQDQIENWLASKEQELLKQAKAKADKLDSSDKDHLSYPTFDPESSYYGQIADIDASRTDKKYVRVQKSVDGRTISAWCYVTYSMLQAHQNGDLAQGDYVIVHFVDEDLDKPIVDDKVIGF